MAAQFAGFEDMGDDFDLEPVASEMPKTLEDASKNKSVKDLGKFRETCQRCMGSGRYHRATEHGTICLACNGVGYKSFKTSKEDRAAKREKAANRAVIKHAQNIAAFEILNPDIAAWWNASNGDFQFATSLRDWVGKNGSLTPGQMGAAKRCIEKLASMVKERLERAHHAAVAGVLDVSAVTKAFKSAKSCAIKRPKMRLLIENDDVSAMVISEAPAHSVNAGSLYVKSTDGVYLGKITNGLYLRSREVDDALETNIREALSDPATAAVAYGRRTGECSCCGRELTNAESIERGIGPICADNFGF